MAEAEGDQTLELEDVRDGSAESNFLSPSEGITYGNEGVTSGNEWITSGNEWITSGNEWITSGNEGITSGNEGITSGNEWITSGNEGITSGNEGIISGNEGTTSGNEGVNSGDIDDTWVQVNSAENKPVPVMRQLSAKEAKVLRPLSVLSWEGSAVSNSHLWYSVDTSELCYLSNCLDPKAPKEGKVRCSACSVVAHFGCKAQLVSTHGVVCKETFREIKQKVKDTTLFHHFLLRCKVAGRCKLCAKGFGTRVFSVKEVVCWSCSWCGDSYHFSCFDTERLREQPCLMGPLRNMIVPPSWIVRTPVLENSPVPPIVRRCVASTCTSCSSGHTPYTNPNLSDQSRPAPTTDGHTPSTNAPTTAPSTDGHTPRTNAPNTASLTCGPRKNSRKKRRSLYEEDRASKFFVVKPMMQEHSKPLVVFVNPKSGGNQGAKLLQTFHWLLNPRQVFDLTKGGPVFGLKMFLHVPNLRILVCGGDGTAGWVLSVLDEILEKRKQEFDHDLARPPVAVLPLGTGNDLARILGWGGGYSGGSLERILMHVETGKVVNLDRWLLFSVPNETVPHTEIEQGAVKDVPLHVVNNYFSIGADASVALEFHLGREARPDKYKTRIENKFHYTKLGSKDFVKRKFTNFTDSIIFKGDGIDYTEKLQQLKIETLCFLNIPSYASGTNPWGHPSGEDKNIHPQAIDDGLIEVVGFWATSMPMLQVGLGHGLRIAQCQHIKVTTTKCIPVQVDGEACMLVPSTIIVIMKNKVPMIMRSSQRGSLSDVSPEECQQDRIQLPVYKVSIEVYEKCSLFQQARELATDVGVILATMDCTLNDIRHQINELLAHTTTNGADEQGWTFLNAADSGILQVQREDEGSLHVKDMPLDGLVILEVPCTSPTVPVGPTLSVHPTLPVGGAEACQKTASINEPCSKAEKEQFAQWKVHKSIFKAAMKGDLASLKKTHENGNNLFILDDLGRSPLHYAARNGKEEVVRYLVTNTSKEQLNRTDTESGQCPLHKAAIHDQLDICKILVENGASISLQDSKGDTPYDLAVEHHSVRVQEYLKDDRCIDLCLCHTQLKKTHENGNNLFILDDLGRSPLHYAARNGKEAVVRYLVTNTSKEQLNLTGTESGQCPLHTAAIHDQLDICKILVENGASIFLYRTPSGQCPLHTATIHDQLDICKILVENGASISLQDSKGDTPYDLAVEHRSVRVQEYLKALMGPSL